MNSPDVFLELARHHWCLHGLDAGELGRMASAVVEPGTGPLAGSAHFEWRVQL